MRLLKFIAALLIGTAAVSPVTASANSGKTLVVYYSATSNTQRIAEIIAKELNADLFKIETEKEYSKEDLNYNDPESRVSKEHADEAVKAEIKLKKYTPDNFSEYEHVFIGYPIWWGNAAFPVEIFVKNIKFDNKKIYPFCTSFMSPLDQSDINLQKLSNKGNWLPGHRFSPESTEKEVKNWLSDLKIK